MNLSPKLKEVRWRLLIALHVLLFLCDIAWAHAPSSTTSPEALAALHAGAKAGVAVAGGGAYAINHSPAIDALQCTLPGASIATPQTLTCARGSITLSGSATEPSVTYLWAGPSGYSSALQNPVVSLPGTYNLTVTNTAGGCTSTASVEVIQNVELPGATAAVSHALDCANSTVNLQATTSISNATFLWIGNNFTSIQQNPAITAPGGYTLNVTNPANGCTSTATVNVTRSITKPGVTPFVSGPLTCTTTEVQLDASSPTAEAEFSWTGPGNYSDNTQSPFVSLEGVYTARATNPLNSCFSTATITVQKNVVEPGATITPSGEVTCVNTSVTLNGGATASDVNYSWTGPSPFVPTSVQNPTASVAGTYVLTVTKVSNGCTTQANYTIVPNTTRPGATASVSGQLNCTNGSVQLFGNSPTATVSYRWIGPAGSGFPSTLKEPFTSTRGGYTLIVTNTANGCTSNAVVGVIQSIVAPQNVAIAAPEVLTCTRESVTLAGSSTTSNVTYLWTGPGQITGGNTNSATVTEPGDYTLTVTNPANQCFVERTVTVLQNITAPQQVTIDAPLVLTCTRQSIDLAGHYPGTSNVSYLWTGPGQITNPNNATASVTQPGDYTLQVTDLANNCFTTVPVTVLQNLHAPEEVTIDVPLVLTCTRQSVNLVGHTTTGNVSYLWTGPGQITNANNATASVSEPGDYVLKVTDLASNCFTEVPVTVLQNIVAPEQVTIDVPLVLTCTRQSVNLVGHTTTSNVSYLWTGPGQITDANAATASVSDPGDYTLRVTDLVNNCFTEVPVTVLQNIVAPEQVAIATPLVLTCTRQSVDLAASTSTGNVSYLWTGPGVLSGATAATATVNQPGEYTLRVTDNVNGCFTDRTVIVNQDITSPGVSIPTPAMFTCIVSTIRLEAVSGAGMQYAWTGPGNFTSTVFNPEVTVSGTYNVIVTNPVNGCTSQTSVITQEDKANPGVDGSVSLSLTCALTTVFLESSSIPNVQYSWSGPDNYTSAEQFPTTTRPGLYTVRATNPANGCFSEDVVFVNQDVTEPIGVVASASGDITCDQPTISLFGDPSSADLSYAWTGPEGFISEDQNPSGIDTPGIYRLTVTKNSNGCDAQSEVTIILNNTAPEGVAANVSSALTCVIQSVTLTGASTTPGVTYAWSGPGTVTVLTPETASVSTAGIYQLTVNNAANGCSATAFVTVQQNITQPGVVASVVNNQKLTCTVQSVTLHAQSVPGATFIWSGPDGYANNQQNPTANKAGVYTVVATDPDNGCTSTHSVTVEEDIQDPQGVTASFAGTGIITCDQPNISITGASSTSGVTYSWSGDGTVTNPLQATASVATPGLYTVTVTNPANGCAESAGVTVSRNIEVPQNVAVGTPSGTLLTCVTQTVPLNATTSTSNVTYTWTGTGAFTTPTPATAAVTGPGTYHLVVKNNANGCVTSPADVVVTQNITTTLGNISTPGGTALTCATGSVPLNGSGSPAGAVSFRWEGPSGFTAATQNTSATAPGEYALIITHNISGCFRRVTIPVTQNLTTITATANANSALNCANSLVTLTGVATGANQFTWTGPGIVGSANTAQTTVNAGGTYTLNVSTPGNCTATATVFVPSNFSEPEDITITTEGTVTECFEGFVILSGNSSTIGASYLWQFPDGTEVPDQQTLTITPGLYTLIVKHPESECTDSRDIEVIAEPCTEMTAFNSTAQLQNIENAFIAGVYPNPAKDKASIEFTPDGNYHATVEVYTLLNVKVATPYMGEVSAGKTYTAVFDSGNHLNGVYIYRIVYGSGKTKEGRFIVMH